MKVIEKRDRTTVGFDPSKITRAVALAFRDAKRAAIGINCDAPSFSIFVKALTEQSPENLLGDRQELFYGIVDDTFNGEKIPTEQQLGRLNRSLSRAGIDPSEDRVAAILGAAKACAHRAGVNPADDPRREALSQFPYGLSERWWDDVARISEAIVNDVNDKEGRSISVESVQDLVEENINRAGHFDVAKSYILYRNERERERPLSYGDAGKRAIAGLVQISKYARFDESKKRREIWEESVLERMGPMLLRRYQGLGIDDELTAAIAAVARKEVLPSMRAMQFGGKAIEVNHARMFNCSFTLCDRPAVFRESLFLLLSGCGVGYSVQRYLPPFVCCSLPI